MKQKTKAVIEGGKLLAGIRKQLVQATEPGVRLIEIDRLAEQLITQAGGKPSFRMVPGYQYSTCISVNEGVVHGVPTERKIKSGDLVSIDLGLYYLGYHTDAATSFIVGRGEEKDRQFLKTGKKALKRAIDRAKPGKRVGQISQVIQETIETAGFSCARSLTGHGIGKKLHLPPSIPCVLHGSIARTPPIERGQILAIEVIYIQGSPDLILADDGWTLHSRDGSLAALFEETILIEDNPIILTEAA